MSYTITDKFSEFKIDPSTEESGHVWDNAERYKSSYFQQSAKNVSTYYEIYILIYIMKSLATCFKKLN
jgi:hypothetical protein